MESLSRRAAHTLASSRGITLPETAKTIDYLQEISRRSISETPFGINPNSPSYINVAQLRLLPLSSLRKEMAKHGHTFGLNNPSYEYAINDLLQQYYESDDLDKSIKTVLTYWQLPISQMQKITGLTTISKYELVLGLVQGF